MAPKTGRRSIYVPRDATCPIHRLLAMRDDNAISTTIESAVGRYLEIIEHSLPDLEDNEWCAIFDAMRLVAETGTAETETIAPSVSEALHCRDLAGIWDIDGDRLSTRLNQCTHAERQAIAEMTELFWRESEHVSYRDTIRRLTSGFITIKDETDHRPVHRMSPEGL